jgi:hypothetical protein
MSEQNHGICRCGQPRRPGGRYCHGCHAAAEQRRRLADRLGRPARKARLAAEREGIAPESRMMPSLAHDGHADRMEAQMTQTGTATTAATKQTVINALAAKGGIAPQLAYLQAAYRNRVAAVNRALKLAGREEKLVRGNGYYYFINGAADGWRSVSVSVCYADSLTLERWLDEFDALKNDWRNN